MKKYTLTIGLEIHVEVDTETKMFCRCANRTKDEPNTNICPVCLGLPGALPVPNMLAVEKIISLGLALGGQIPKVTKWDRKNYYYPDLPKGYQISQYDEPIVNGGAIEIEDKKINLTRIHLEEDTAKLTHPDKAVMSLIDLNRAGAPLIEMVSEPELHSADDTKKFCQEFQKILRHLNISSAEMEKGKMRCEANISVAPEGAKELGTKVEVKNLNSFKAVERSIIFEEQRQINLIEAGEKVIQETRGWSDSRQRTYPQRIKESADDYRYFPEPDIPKIDISLLTKKCQGESSGDLPSQRRNELIEKYNLTKQEAEKIILNNKYFEYFLNVMQKVEGKIKGRVVASWMIDSKFGDIIPQEDFVTLLKMVNNKAINDTTAREIAKKISSGTKLSELLNGFRQLDETELIPIIKQVLQENPKAVQDYKAGKIQVMQYLFGQIMKITKGQIDSDVARKILIKELL